MGGCGDEKPWYKEALMNNNKVQTLYALFRCITLTQNQSVAPYGPQAEMWRMYQMKTPLDAIYWGILLPRSRGYSTFRGLFKLFFQISTILGESVTVTVSKE